MNSCRIVTITGISLEDTSSLTEMLIKEYNAEKPTFSIVKNSHPENGNDEFTLLTKPELLALQNAGLVVSTCVSDVGTVALLKRDVERVFDNEKSVVLVADPHCAAEVKSYGVYAGWNVLSIFLDTEEHPLRNKLYSSGYDDEMIEDLLLEQKKWRQLFTFDLSIDPQQSRTGEIITKALGRHCTR